MLTPLRARASLRCRAFTVFIALLYGNKPRSRIRNQISDTYFLKFLFLFFSIIWKPVEKMKIKPTSEYEPDTFYLQKPLVTLTRFIQNLRKKWYKTNTFSKVDYMPIVPLICNDLTHYTYYNTYIFIVFDLTCENNEWNPLQCLYVRVRRECRKDVFDSKIALLLILLTSLRV